MTGEPVKGWSRDERRDVAHVREVIRRWINGAQDSALYVHLTTRMLDDEPMLALAARMDNVPPMNLLLGGVKLLLTESEALAAWYPHLAGTDVRAPNEEAYRHFRGFALDHADELTEVGAMRRTQTNEAGRSASVLPWLAAAARAWEEPVHLVDLGSSAGLNLCLDRFDYAYGSTTIGARDRAPTSLMLTCDNRGEFALPSTAPAIATRHGVDLMPVDATDPDHAAWLEALVWPEHLERLARLRAAIAIRRDTDVVMHAADAATTVAELGTSLPPGPMIVMHTVMAYQLTDGQRAAIDDAVADVAGDRPVVRVGMEPTRRWGHPVVTVGLRREDAVAVALAHAHGAWIDRA